MPSGSRLNTPLPSSSTISAEHSFSETPTRNAIFFRSMRWPASPNKGVHLTLPKAASQLHERRPTTQPGCSATEGGSPTSPKSGDRPRSIYRALEAAGLTGETPKDRTTLHGPDEVMVHVPHNTAAEAVLSARRLAEALHDSAYPNART